MLVQAEVFESNDVESPVNAFVRKLAEMMSSEPRREKARRWISDEVFNQAARSYSTRNLVYPFGR